MTDKCKVPEIRFKGFLQKWRLQHLGDVIEDYIEKTTIQNQYPVLTSSQQLGVVLQESYFANRQVTTNKNIGYFVLPKGYFTYRSRSDTDIFVFNRNDIIDKGTISYFYPVFKVKDADSDFFLRRINHGTKQQLAMAAAGTGQRVLSHTKFKKMVLLFPLIEEQKKIGSFFQNLDSLITVLQRKYDKLITVKKAMLEKMFPKDGADVPEIRFEGFTEKWEQRKLREITIPFAEPVPTPKDGYWRLGIRSHAKGTFHDFVRAGRELETAKMHKVSANNFIVNITFAWEHAVAITDVSDDGKLVSHRFPQFSFNEGMVPGYFKLLILDKRFKYHLWLSSPGGAGRNRVLKINEMLEYPFWVPKETEQSKIANFFQHLDSLIDLQQRELDKLKSIKKACLEKMLV